MSDDLDAEGRQQPREGPRRRASSPSPASAARRRAPTAASSKRRPSCSGGYVDAANVTDNQTAVVRVCSLAAAHMAQLNGVEAVMQMTCRDRNRLAMQADILGAATLGVKNILCLTGDHISFGNHPQAKGVHDLDSVSLIRMYKDMRDEKRFQCGEEMDVAPPLYIGCAENPFGDPLEFRALRLKKKVEAGADFVQTQCIFNVPRFKQWMEEVRALGLHQEVKILAGITPHQERRHGQAT